MSIEDDVTLLSSVPTLAQLGMDAICVLAIGSEAKRLRNNETLFRMGDTSDAGYVVQSGAVRVSSYGDGGTHDVIANPGALIGELALLLEMQRPSTAVAIAETIVLRISRSMFLRVLEGHPDAAQRMRDELAARITQSTGEMSAVTRKLVK